MTPLEWLVALVAGCAGVAWFELYKVWSAWLSAHKAGHAGAKALRGQSTRPQLRVTARIDLDRGPCVTNQQLRKPLSSICVVPSRE